MKKTLEELENTIWPTLIEYPTLMIQKCYELRKVPICELRPEHLRLLLTQNIGNEFLMPLAIDILAENIIMEAQYFSGDLLKSVLESNPSYWKLNSDMFGKMKMIIKFYGDHIYNTNEIDENSKIDLINAIKNFEALEV